MINKNMMTNTHTRSGLTDKKTMAVKSDKELDSKIGKANLIKGQGPDKIKDLEKPDEDKKYSDGKHAKNMAEESSSPFEGAFERFFKATIIEEEDENNEIEMPISSDDTIEEIEDTEEQESNLISDLQNVMSKLQDILDKLSEEEPEEEESEEEESEEEESEEEESEEEESEEEPYEESMDLTQKNHMKVPGKIHSSKGTVHKGDFKSSPYPKSHKNKGELLKSKGAMKVKSSVTPGDFFK